MRVIAIILLTGLTGRCYSQVPDIGNWFGLQLPVKLNQKWEWWNDGTFRTVSTSFTPFQYTVRSGLRYALNQNWSTAAGLAMFFSRASFSKDVDDFVTEWRIWEEVDFHPAITDKLRLLNRFRVDERFFSSVAGRSAFNEVRLRYRLGLPYSLSDKFSLEPFDEYMHSFLHESFQFTQNRLGLNAYYQISQKGKLQFGYFWAYNNSFSQHWFTILFQQRLSLNGNKHPHS